MGFRNKTPRQVEAAKSGLWVMQERQQLKQMHEQEFGSCVRCVHNDTDDWQCKECVNGGGSLKLFEQKTKRIKRR